MVTKPRLSVIVGSTRPTRVGGKVADWFVPLAEQHGRFAVETVDLQEVALPLYDEPRHPRFRQYEHEHTKAWSEVVNRADAYVLVTPEYDHGPPASVINALQFLLHEWSYKPMGFVSYGGVSAGTRAMNTLKQTVTSLKVMPMFESVSIPFVGSHVDKESGLFDPGEVQQKAVVVMLDELLRWESALRELRRPNKES
ncbi:MAG: NADPH-dependent FMN reductase [Gemmatimonadaceae bacterium]